jgi:hypothetical protein
MQNKAKSSPQIIVPEAPTAPEVFAPKELDPAEQRRRAQISESKSTAAPTLLGASSDSDITTLLKKNLLGR